MRVVTLGQSAGIFDFLKKIYYHGNLIGSACVANLRGQWLQCLRRDNDVMSG